MAEQPPMYYNDFYEDLLTTKRNDVHSAGCDCKVTVCWDSISTDGCSQLSIIL